MIPILDAVITKWNNDLSLMNDHRHQRAWVHRQILQRDADIGIALPGDKLNGFRLSLRQPVQALDLLRTASSEGDRTPRQARRA